MSVTELLNQFTDPGVMHSLSMTDKLMAGLVTTLLGMGITFAALILLQLVISWMDRLINRPAADTAGSPETATEPAVVKETTTRDDHELVAVLTAAIAMKMKTSIDRIVIRNIEKVEDRSPAWNRAGIIEQMNSRF